MKVERPSWAPVPNKPTVSAWTCIYRSMVSVDVKQHSTNPLLLNQDRLFSDFWDSLYFNCEQCIKTFSVTEGCTYYFLNSTGLRGNPRVVSSQ